MNRCLKGISNLQETNDRVMSDVGIVLLATNTN